MTGRPTGIACVGMRETERPKEESKSTKALSLKVKMTNYKACLTKEGLGF